VATSLFTSQVPEVPDGNDGSDYTLGTALRRSTSGQIIRGRWYFPATLPTGTTEWVLYDGAGVELHREAFVTPVAGQWNITPQFDPIDYTANDLIVPSVYTSGQYVATVGFFAGGDLVNGDITAPASENGRLSNTDSYPSNEVNLCFFADLVFAESAVDAELAATLPALTAALAGDVVDPAVLAAVLPALTAGLTGDTYTAGALAATLPALTAALAGDAVDPAALAAALPSLTAALTGDAVDPAVLAAVLPALTAQLLGEQPIPARRLRASTSTAALSARAATARLRPGSSTSDLTAR
jgi:hypothetical protein